ncbi:hypothetical protein KC19_6G020500 [Ceratodon purpureus]|uniref:Uncharacterized protein n=1 Tax=Ceratodon purpureus TaxID=3225 RepID=A0A8T0HH61_CERPU|nr:hypothetical protein KC19_6G020500 [Ceratodon purpureus]
MAARRLGNTTAPVDLPVARHAHGFEQTSWRAQLGVQGKDSTFLSRWRAAQVTPVCNVCASVNELWHQSCKEWLVGSK